MNRMMMQALALAAVFGIACAAAIKSDFAKYGKLIRDIGFKPQ